MTRDELRDIGFKELPHFTITNSLVYDLGRNRYLSIGDIGEPNEMLFLCESNYDDPRKVDELICLRNYDYDGYTNIDDIKMIIEGICGGVKCNSVK